MAKKVFIPEGANIVGPYSPAIGAGDFVFCSGQIPISDGKIIEGDISAQTKQCLENLLTLLKSADLTVDNICKTTIYLTNMNDFVAVNEVYASYFNPPYPARTTICVAVLPLGAKIEIEVIAHKL